MSNKILTFCAVFTSFTALGCLNISSAEALPANQVGGEGFAGVGASTFGLNRTFSAGSNAGAISPSSAMTNSNSTLMPTPTTAGASANSMGKAGSQLQGNGNTNSTISGSPGQITAGNESNARITGATTGAVSAGSSSALNSNAGVGSANGNYQFSGVK